MPARGAGLRADRPARSIRSAPTAASAASSRWNVGPDAKGEEAIHFVTGRDGPANHGRLCVKGRYGFDYIHNPKRLTRAADAPRRREQGPRRHRALQARRVAARRRCFARRTGTRRWIWLPAAWRSIRDSAPAGSGSALAGFGSAKGSNEEAYLFQKLVRTAMHSAHVDHCTRLCHASSVAALLEGIGSGAVSNPVEDVAQAELIFLIGANPTVNHPVAATWIKNAVDRGARLVICRSASHLAHAARHLAPAVPPRHRRGVDQRHAACGDRGGPGRPGLHRRARERLRGAEGRGGRSHARAHERDLRHRRRHDPRGRPRLRDFHVLR